MHRQAAIGFQRAAAQYERSRPGYPDEIVRWIVRRLGIDRHSIVIDLAAGTGKLTRALLATDARIIAVEPVPAMLAALRAATGARVQAVAATAQALPLATGRSDAITVAQAFHWFASPAALAEMTRVLRPRGHIALVWNRRLLDDPLQAALSAILDPHRGDTPSMHGDRWRAVVDASDLVAPAGDLAVDNAQVLDIAGLVDRVVSTSFVAALPEDVRQGVEARVSRLEDVFGPRPVLRYRCEAYLLSSTR